MQEVEANIQQVYPFIRKSETHRHELLSLNLKIDKKTLGAKGTAIELLAGLLTLAGDGLVGPSFGDDVVLTLDKVSEQQDHALWAALRRNSYQAAKVLLPAVLPMDDKPPTTAGGTAVSPRESVAVKYSQGMSTNERAISMIHRISSHRVYAEEFAKAKVCEC